MDPSIVAGYLAAAGLPLFLVVLSALFRHFYLRALDREFKKQAPAESRDREPGFDPSRAPLRLLWQDANAVEKWPRAAEETDAARETRRVKAAFVISGIVWAVLTAMMVGVGLITRGLTPQSATAVASMNTASALVVILAFVRPRISVIVIVAIGWVGLEFLLLTGPVGASWRAAATILAGAPRNGILIPVPAMALFALRTLRPLIAGFVPAVGLWICAAAAVGVTLLAFGLTLNGQVTVSAVLYGTASLVAGGAIAIRQIRKGISRSFLRWWITYLAAAAALALASDNVILKVPAGVGVNGSLVLAGWALFRYFLQLKAQGRITDDVLHFTGCWMVLSVWTYSVAQLEWFQLPWVLAALIAYGAVFYTLLRSRQKRRPARAPKRLLLLRVFHPTAIDKRLLDVLDDSWRRFGRLDLVVWMDLALWTLNALTIENFLLGRVQRQFLGGESDARKRLPRLPDSIALDGRYPMNEIHCQSGIWQDVVIRLVRESDIVLMDLRGFQQRNQGMIVELSIVIRWKSLSRLVLLTDTGSDERLIAEIVQTAWHTLPPDSPNANRPDLAQLQVVRCAASWPVTAKAIARKVFSAANGAGMMPVAQVH